MSSGVPRDQATLLAALPGIRARRARAAARLRRARGDGRPAAPGRDRSEQRAVPRRAAGGLRDPRRAPDHRRAALRARRARGDRGPEGGGAVRRPGAWARASPSATATGRWSASSRPAATCTSRRSGPTPRSRCRRSGAPASSRSPRRSPTARTAGLAGAQGPRSRAIPGFSISVLREPEYYAKQARCSPTLINVLGYTVAAFMAVGAMFGALNCMYSAIAEPPGRDRHAAGHRLRRRAGGGLGDDRGAAAGAARRRRRRRAGLRLLRRRVAVHAELQHVLAGGLRLPRHAARSSPTGIAWALVIGALGGLPPAIRAARIPVTLALRAL